MVVYAISMASCQISGLNLSTTNVQSGVLEMKKIVINADYGGFCLSREAVLLARKLSNNPKWGGCCIKGDIWEDSKKTCDTDYGYINDITRDDAVLVAVVAKLKKKANNAHSNLKIVSIPDGVEWQVEEYDGSEWIAEKHRTWR